ncbi:ParB family protein [Pseudomonas synxantha]|uniref:ParB family protein of integrating conjugative element (PFGI_1 class) n=1 Tax=Pseudomonas synxantha TaxID=47883 RepID=A0ACC6JVH0_9PSED|nr:ParB family protein [Pseudomonas synxantha]MDR6610537.1 ParB family protein of integrating conjugative element (PFGI_1 class) [Pseudomonas synxantha]
MTDRRLETMANHLLTEGFERNGPATETLSDPIVDTPMIITLDRLKPYDLDPRVTRNPRYDEIKESIRQRGLDAPPSITRRPGEPHFRIRNGGNTRLSILHELWSETKDEKFYRLACLFRPWPQRGEIVALTGHLAENELRGALSFIERALGVEKARQLYEQESGAPLSQSELSRRLTADGYPTQQSHISRMRDAVQYLLPAIPNVLYGGLGRHQVERLAVMRRSAERIWEEHSKGKILGIDFPALFQEALVLFDGETAAFSLARVQDELIGQMAQWLNVDYDTLALESEAGERRQQALGNEPQRNPKTDGPINLLASPKPLTDQLGSTSQKIDNSVEPVVAGITDKAPSSPTTDRLQSIQQMVAEHTGDIPNSPKGVLPLAQNSLFPISDIWNIEPGLDAPERLRVHISQFAREIAQDSEQAECITTVDEGIGFRCAASPPNFPHKPAPLIALLNTLTTDAPAPSAPLEIGALLLGANGGDGACERMSDANLIKLFRLIRLARRLIDLKPDNPPTPQLR